MKVVATILAVEPRRQFAEGLLKEVSAYMPVKMSCAPNRQSLEDAFKRSKELMDFATLQNADWHLYLEDDQKLTDQFYIILPQLLVGTADCWYLSDRAIPIGNLGWQGNLRVNRIRQAVAGSHGLLYRTSFIAALQNDPKCRPVDHWFWQHINTHKHKIFQILNPVCARHVGEVSTLHEYKHNEHMFKHPEGL